jgi:hypothetical protein
METELLSDNTLLSRNLILVHEKFFHIPTACRLGPKPVNDVKLQSPESTVSRY